MFNVGCTGLHNLGIRSRSIITPPMVSRLLWATICAMNHTPQLVHLIYLERPGGLAMASIRPLTRIPIHLLWLVSLHQPVWIGAWQLNAQETGSLAMPPRTVGIIHLSSWKESVCIHRMVATRRTVHMMEHGGVEIYKA